MERKYCIVPQCFNSTVKTPDKLFFYVPEDPKMRKKWMSAVKRVDSIGPKTKAHCCEDHFDVENDMDNYVKYKLVGGKLKLKKGVVPHRFACQKQSVEKPERSLVKKLKIAKLTASRCELRVVFKARGLMPPVFTPLNDDYTINYEVIPAYADYLTKAGIKSVLVGGTTGEHMSLNVADRKKVVDAWVKSAKTTGLHIQVQVGGAPLADVMDLASYCEKAGADSLLTLPELYFRPQNVNELVSYVELVAKAAPNLPVLYYHIPSMSKVEINMPAFVTAATARIPNFKGIKFTSNDLSEGAQVLRALKDDQEMFLGADTLLAPAALLGIKSSIGTTWNLFPRLAQDILDAVEKNDVAKARALQEQLSLAIEAHTVEGAWVPIMKAGMEIVSGIKVGPPSLPQRPIAEEARKRIEDRLRNLRIIN